MPEQLTEVKTYRVQYLCDECGEPVQPTGVRYLTSSPQYPHMCPNGHKVTLGAAYPNTQTRNLNE